MTGQSRSTVRTWMAMVGDFFFKWRNQAFPLILLAIYILVPPSNKLAGSEALEAWRDLLALLLVFAGLALRAIVIGFAYIKRGGVGKKVYAADLVTGGMFGVCRNPLYVGNLLIVLGVLTMHGDPRVMGGGAILMGFIYQSIVFAEERFLRGKFGNGYLAYCRDVPRWGLRLSRFAASIDGMRFDLKKALYIDYGTIATSTAILAATEIYEQLAHPADPPSSTVILGMAAVLAGAVVATALIRAHKLRAKRQVAT